LSALPLEPGNKRVYASPFIGRQHFLSGHAFLADGKLLVTGGHIVSYQGLATAYRYAPSANTWTSLPDMNAGRWYPTTTGLGDGNALVISGQDNGLSPNTPNSYNKLPQVWQVSSSTWRDLSSALLALPYYPYMFVSPNGKVFLAGPLQLTRYLDVSGTGSWSTVGNNNWGVRNWGSATMYAPGKVLLMGGTTCGWYAKNCSSTPTATAETIDLTLATPSWSYTDSMSTGPRKLHNSTLLPDGQVFVTGGSRGTEDPNHTSNTPAYESEMWDPGTGQWSVMASLSVYRGYHSTALLLPDGRVLSAGGDWAGDDGSLAASAEVYSPPYLFKGARPIITSVPMSISYGEAFTVTTPNGSSIAKVSLIALGSVTHGFNQGQRINFLTYSKVDNIDGSVDLNVTPPPDGNSAPPGYYMLFILNGSGVPSVAEIIKLHL
jgi:hypothetical protein